MPLQSSPLIRSTSVLTGIPLDTVAHFNKTLMSRWVFGLKISSLQKVYKRRRRRRDSLKKTSFPVSVKLQRAVWDNSTHVESSAPHSAIYCIEVNSTEQFGTEEYEEGITALGTLRQSVWLCGGQWEEPTAESERGAMACGVHITNCEKQSCIFIMNAVTRTIK